MLYFVSPQVALESQTTYAMASSCFTVAFMTKAAISAAKALGFDIKQLEVIVKFAMGRDVFAILPTGFGKTLCYQCLPGVFQPNLLWWKRALFYNSCDFTTDSHHKGSGICNYIFFITISNFS